MKDIKESLTEITPDPGEQDIERIALCFPHRGHFTGEYARFFAGAKAPEGYRFLQITTDSSSIASNSNTMVNQALERPDVQWILQIDSDQIVEPDIPAKLIQHINQDRYRCRECDRVTKEPHCDDCGGKADKMDIRDLGALTYIYKNDLPIPLVPIAEHEGIWHEQLANSTLIESNRVGTGCLLTHRSVFEEIEPPYFMDQFDHTGERIETEDFVFAEKLEKAGINSYIDMSLVVGHKKKVSMKQTSFVLNTAFACQTLDEFEERF